MTHSAFRSAVRMLPFAALSAGVLALAGCALAEDRRGPCPPAFVLKDASQITKFTGGGRDVTDTLYSGAVTGVTTGCFNFGDSVESEAEIRFSVSAGPALRSKTQDIQYFVALMREDRVVAKEIYARTVTFQQGQRTVTFTEEIEEVAIPISARPEALKYQIVVGFQLTEDEVEYNRTKDQFAR